MKLTRTKRSHAVVFNITPMIDIVFLLIIFFMTVSQITRVVDHPLALPIVGDVADDKVASSVTININKQGNIIVSGKQYSLQHTIEVLRRKIDQLDGDTKKMRMELRCDRHCQSGHINRIIEELSDLGIKYVRIATAENS